MREKKLKNAPMKEAIFELYWKLPNDETNFPTDPDLPFALGLFKEAISSQYPVLKRLTIPGGNKLKIYPKPDYQFWKGELQYPVIQLGPGMLTVNDTDKNYSWEGNYQGEIIRAVETLINSYKGKLNFNRFVLKYIDSVDVPNEISFNDFIRHNFKISISTDFTLPGVPSGLNINQVFILEDESLMTLNIQSAINNNNKKKAIIWITSVEKKANLTKEEVMVWLDRAHTLCSDSFEEMLNPEFYAQFNK